MSLSSSWVSNLEQALVLFDQKNFDEALAAFDKVPKSQGYTYQIFASRMEVLSRLSELQVALGGAKRPMSWERFNEEAGGREELTTEESTQLFQLLGRLLSYLRNSIMALRPEYIPESSLAPKSAISPRSRTSTRRPDPHRLPPRRTPHPHLSTPHRFHGGGRCRRRCSRVVPFILSSVCRHWRHVFLSVPSLWGRLIVRPDDGEEKMEAMLSKGPLKKVWVQSSFEEEEEEVSNAFELLKGRVGPTTELRVSVNEETTLEDLWQLWDPAKDGFSLTNLDISHNTPLHYEDEPQGRKLHLPTPPPLELDTSTLTSLSLLSFIFADKTSLYPLLQRFPNLQSLVLDSSSVVFSLPDATPSTPTIVHLPNLLLLQIEIESSEDVPSIRNQPSTVFHLPKLQALLAGDGIPLDFILFPPSPHPSNAEHLLHLDISFKSQVELDEAVFVDQLARLPALEELNLATELVTDATLEGLVWSEGKTGEGGLRMRCPDLRKLDVQSAKISFEALLRMVTSRRDASLRGGGCARIEELIVDEQSTYMGEK